MTKQFVLQINQESFSGEEDKAYTDTTVSDCCDLLSSLSWTSTWDENHSSASDDNSQVPYSKIVFCQVD
jgi:hypothetical protein